jgi:signal transduction histidine kinase
MKSETLHAVSARTSSAFEQDETSAASADGRLYLIGDGVIFSLALILALVTASECHSITHMPSLLYGVVLWGWWGCIASALWRFGRRIPLLSRFSPQAIAIHILTGSALGVTHLLLLGSIGFVVQEWRVAGGALAVWTSELHINRFGMELLLYGFAVGVSGIIQVQIRARREEMRSLELQRQLSAAHLRALQMQLEPHFLFNTLNAITTLVELGRQKPAAEMLAHLNVILKSTLARDTPEKVPLSQELEFVRNYLAIEQVRFADRLRIEWNVDPSALDGLVPCFLLQPIVENAIRHGIAHCEHDGFVEVSATRQRDALRVRVGDSGAGRVRAQQPGYGIGLKNTRDRLEHFYGDGYAMRAQPLSSGGFEVVITIPFEGSEQGVVSDVVPEKVGWAVAGD